MRPIQKFPAGFKFRPTEQEILLYLQCKVNDVKPERMVDLKEIDIYNFENPEDLFEDTEEDVIHVFTKLKRVFKNGKRNDRTVGSCVWKGSDKGKPILSGETCMGRTKNFSFEYKNSRVKLGYNMKEFSLDDSILRGAKYPDYVLCTIKRKSKDEENSITENLQGLTEDPISPTDKYGFQGLPAQAVSDNGFMDIASSSMVPYTEVCQYEEKNETIAYHPWPLPAEGCGNQYQNMPSNEVFHNQYQNMPLNEVCHNQYQELPSAEPYSTHYQVRNGLTAGVPLADEVYQTQYQQKLANEVFQIQYQETPSNVVDQNPYQSMNELIADVPLASRNEYQEINGLIAYAPSNPYFGGNQNQEALWTKSTVAFTHPEELDEKFNTHSDLNLITELASVPAFSCLSDNLMYSEFTSQPIVPLPIDQPTPKEGFQLPFSGEYQQEIQRAIATVPSTAIFPTSEPIAMMPSVTAPQIGETKPVEGSEILFSQENKMEIEEPTAMAPPITVPPLVSSQVREESMLPTHHEEETDANPQQDMNVDGGECIELGTSIASILRSFKEEALDKKDDPMIANPWGLENVRDFFMPVNY